MPTHAHEQEENNKKQGPGISFPGVDCGTDMQQFVFSPAWSITYFYYLSCFYFIKR